MVDATGKKTLAIVLGSFAALVFAGFLAVQCGKTGSSSQSPRGAPDVEVYRSDFVLRVANRRTENWNVMIVYINGRPPFTYKWEGRAPAVGQSITIPLREFTKESGDRFDTYRTKVVEVWVGGDGYDYQGLHF